MKPSGRKTRQGIIPEGTWVMHSLVKLVNNGALQKTITVLQNKNSKSSTLSTMRSFSLAVIIFLGTFSGYSQQIKKMTIGDLEGYISKSEKPLVVNFWATYCLPCIEEIPYFQNTIEANFKNKIELILVSLDLPDYYPAKISSVVTKKKFSAPIVWLNEADADYFCPRIDSTWSGAIPATLMVNNKKRYRRFYEQQLTKSQFLKEAEGMMSGE
jgi:thiol-disulfide isomerase/thioredoxin